MKKLFNPSSPGFIYTLIVLALYVATSLGIHFADTPEGIATSFINSFSNGGIWALSGLLLTSILFPIYNTIHSGLKVTWSNVFTSVANWIALGNAAVAALLLFGIAIPVGTVTTIVNAVGAHDWGTLINAIILNVLNPIIRWVKHRNQGA